MNADRRRRWLLRPVQPDDLQALLAMAAASPDGINSLPEDEAKMRARIEASVRSFESPDDASGEETYLFVLEDRLVNRLRGCSGIAARAGFSDRFYTYRNEFVVHANAELGVWRRMHTLNLCHDLAAATLLTSFYVDPKVDDPAAAQLLSRSRLLFIAAHPDRFAELIVAEHPGVTDVNGQSPFWDAVGRRFFQMDYAGAEAVVGARNKALIGDLMPMAPVYVALLPPEAQWALGQLHPLGELPFSILMDEGFDADTYVDIFDGGPTVQASLQSLRTVREAFELEVEDVSVATKPAWHIVIQPTRERFGATLAPIDRVDLALGAGPRLDTTDAAVIGAFPGDRVWAAPVGSES